MVWIRILHLCCVCFHQMLFLKDIGDKNLLSGWWKKGGMKREMRWKWSYLFSYWAWRRVFLFFFFSSRNCWVKCAYQSLPNKPFLHLYAKHLLLEDGANYRACIYPALGACPAPIYISWVSTLPEACRTLLSLQWRAPPLQKQQWLKKNTQTDEAPWIYFFWQPCPYPLNTAWHLDAL